MKRCVLLGYRWRIIGEYFWVGNLTAGDCTVVPVNKFYQNLLALETFQNKYSLSPVCFWEKWLCGNSGFLGTLNNFSILNGTAKVFGKATLEFRVIKLFFHRKLLKQKMATKKKDVGKIAISIATTRIKIFLTLFCRVLKFEFKNNTALT